MSSAICFNLDQSKNLSGNELTVEMAFNSWTTKQGILFTIIES